jgi:predicted metal-dependent HD superfamily phosphohydrolase
MFSRFDRLREGLRRRYAEPHRAYHGQSHIDALRAVLVRERAIFHNPDAVELAIWYHDAVYDPMGKNNEAASAALLRTELTGVVVPQVVDSAERLVLATGGHRVPDDCPPEEAGDCALFLDMDLAVLGQGADQFAAFEAGIEAEFRPHYDWMTYRAGRAGVLRAFLQRDTIYLTERYRDRYETAARANIALALARYS